MDPDESDLVTADHMSFFQDGKRVLTLSGELSEVAMWRELEAYMKRDQFWPNVWFLSDHGNYHLVTKSKRGKRRYR